MFVNAVFSKIRLDDFKIEINTQLHVYFSICSCDINEIPECFFTLPCFAEDTKDMKKTVPHFKLEIRIRPRRCKTSWYVKEILTSQQQRKQAMECDHGPKTSH